MVALGGGFDLGGHGDTSECWPCLGLEPDVDTQVCSPCEKSLNSVLSFV